MEPILGLVSWMDTCIIIIYHDQSSTLPKILLGWKPTNLESFVKHLSLHFKNMSWLNLSESWKKEKNLIRLNYWETILRCRKGWHKRKMLHNDNVQDLKCMWKIVTKFPPCFLVIVCHLRIHWHFRKYISVVCLLDEDF